MSLATSITRTPLAHDTEKGAEAAARFAAHGAAFGALVAGAAGSSPHLATLIAREGDWLDSIAGAPPEETRAAILRDVAAAEPGSLSARFRQAKRRMGLLAALADLGGVWDLFAVTGALSDLADAVVARGIEVRVAEAQAKGSLPPVDAPHGGLFVLAMGKLGARELNYSSDIDLIVLFDESLYDRDAYAGVRKVFVRITQDLVKLVGAETGEGYVFRTDLRLRPDPSVTPVCIGMGAAERYYESQGRTWERAAMIRARVMAGDKGAGARFLEALTPFIWRKHLDFAAIEDAHDMRRRIRDHKGLTGPLRLPGHNVKLGAGGIREIEFFISTKQLICGGRDPSLRVTGTLDALDALVAAGWAEREVAEVLGPAYVAHRQLEHRIQMLEDAQTHIYPSGGEGRARVAALCGAPDRAAFETAETARFAQVSALTDDFFVPDEAEAPGEGIWAAFPNPEEAEAVAQAWASLPALRSERAQGLFERLAPKLAARLCGAADPDRALRTFDRFLRGLPAGVQVFSLFEANEQILDLLIDICATAPRLADYLGRNAGVFDAVLSRDFFSPIEDCAALTAELSARLQAQEHYEDVLDGARIWAREQMFRTGVQLLRRIATPQEAAVAYSAIADAVITALLPQVTAEFARRFGPPPGGGLAVLGMGKLGSAEMTAGSDLDMIVVYDAAATDMSDGPKSLAAPAYYARLTQALIGALTVQTAQGALYEVDMRLRPSGRQGPVATSLKAFASYQLEEAWTWEHLALSRARVIAGPEALCAQLQAAVAAALGKARDAGKELAAVRDMRARIAAERGEGGDPWDIKLGRGGMQDIELCLQAGKVLTPGVAPVAPRAMIPPLVAAGWLTAQEGAELEAVLGRLQAIQHLSRLALDGPFSPERAGTGLSALLAEVTGAEDLPGLLEEIGTATRRAAEIVDRVLGAA